MCKAFLYNADLNGSWHICVKMYVQRGIVFLIVHWLFQETTALSDEALADVSMTPIIIGLGKCKTSYTVVFFVQNGAEIKNKGMQ